MGDSFRHLRALPMTWSLQKTSAEIAKFDRECPNVPPPIVWLGSPTPNLLKYGGPGEIRTHDLCLRRI